MYTPQHNVNSNDPVYLKQGRGQAISMDEVISGQRSGATSQDVLDGTVSFASLQL